MATELFPFTARTAAHVDQRVALRPSYHDLVMDDAGGPFVASYDGTLRLQLPLPDANDWAAFDWERETDTVTMALDRRVVPLTREVFRGVVRMTWSNLAPALLSAAYPILVSERFLMAPHTPARRQQAMVRPPALLTFKGLDELPATRPGYKDGYEVALRTETVRQYLDVQLLDPSYSLPRRFA